MVPTKRGILGRIAALMARHDSPSDLCSHEEDPAEALRAAPEALLPGDDVGELLLKAFAYGYLTEAPRDAPGLSAFIRGPLCMALATSHGRETAHRVVSSLARATTVPR